MCGDEARHELFETARRRAEWTTTDMWVGYLALGGALDLFTIQAYLHGLVPLPPLQQDILANAVNERLADLCRAAQVPYLSTLGDSGPAGEDPLDVVDELLHPGRPCAPPPDAPPTPGH